MNGLKIRRAVVEETKALNEAAAADNHGLLVPTHVVEKDGKVLGVLSVGAMPTVFVWMHTKEAHVRDSLRVMHFYEDILADRGAQFVMVPCVDGSPYHGLMEKAGYIPVTKATLFVKQL